MKKLHNLYTFRTSWDSVNNTTKSEAIERVGEKRNFKTKLILRDFPEWYCLVPRGMGTGRWDIFNAKGIKDIKYYWVKENHFMRDSVLRISYRGPIECIKGVCLWDYSNVDEQVYEQPILQAIAFIKTYSPEIDITPIRDEFIAHCMWLQKHEPCYAPAAYNEEINDFEFIDPGQYFDENTDINKYRDKNAQ